VLARCARGRRHARAAHWQRLRGREGAGSRDCRDFSPYGLSKALTAQVFRYHCARAGLGWGSSSIPNPFGPFEEPRYTAHLMKNWFAGATPTCSSRPTCATTSTVALLAKEYARFAKEHARGGSRRCNPTGYVREPGRVSCASRKPCATRLGLPCPVRLAQQTEFPEPRVRINTDVPDAGALGFDRDRAWDEFAEYYRRILAPNHVHDR